jgi:NADPH2:quinone reductase
VRGKQADLPAARSDPAIDQWVALDEERPAQSVQADIVIDTVGGAAMFERALGFVAKRGTLVEISATGGARVSFDLQYFYRNDLRLVGVNTLNQTAAESVSILRKIAAGFEASAFRAPAERIRRVGLQEAVAAYASVNAGSKDKVVLRPHDDITQ